MQYEVPQFIEVEDKIIGPLTARQFAWLLGGSVLLFFAWMTADIGLFVIEAVVIAGLTACFAFIKVNGMSFQQYMVSVFKFFAAPKLKIWVKDPTGFTIAPKKEEKVVPKKEESYEISRREIYAEKGKLRELSFILDTLPLAEVKRPGGELWATSPSLEEAEKRLVSGLDTGFKAKPQKPESSPGFIERRNKPIQSNPIPQQDSKIAK